MSKTHIAFLLAALLPLALDTFALAAVLGMIGLPRRVQLRTSLILAGFEAGMPVVGYVTGAAFGRVVGDLAGWTAIAVFAVAGIRMLRADEDEQREQERVKLLARAQGVAIIDLGLGISLDELAIGFSLGLIGVPLLVAVIWIGFQALVAAQIGLRLGSRVGEELRERTEVLAGGMLLALAAALLLLKVTGHAL